MVEDTWKNFELSGKISDYLTYRQSAAEVIGKGSTEPVRMTDKSIVSERGLGSYGTERGSDGNGTKCNAGW